MGVDVSHLVLEAARDADDQVVDECTDGAEGGYILARPVVQLDADDVLLGLGKGHGDVAKVFREFS